MRRRRLSSRGLRKLPHGALSFSFDRILQVSMAVPTEEVGMKRVVGIGGIFFKAKDPDALRAWYRSHLGMDIADWGGMTFRWHTPENPNPDGATAWTIFPASST